MKKSIISSKRECYICGNTDEMHRHHVFYGTANRAVSEKYGCWVYLCAHHHNGGGYSVHQSRVLDEWLKRLTQRKWEELYGDREAFIRAFGRSYL